MYLWTSIKIKENIENASSHKREYVLKSKSSIKPLLPTITTEFLYSAIVRIIIKICTSCSIKWPAVTFSSKSTLDHYFDRWKKGIFSTSNFINVSNQNTFLLEQSKFIIKNISLIFVQSCLPPHQFLFPRFKIITTTSSRTRNGAFATLVALPFCTQSFFQVCTSFVGA